MPTPRRIEKSGSLNMDPGLGSLSGSTTASPAVARRGQSAVYMRTAGSSAVQSPAASKPQSPTLAAADPAAFVLRSASGAASPVHAAGAAASNPQLRAYWNVTTLEELLNKLGLQNYVETFASQEVDLSTFLTLSEDDLKELGVTTFGARRKMAMGGLEARVALSPSA